MNNKRGLSGVVIMVVMIALVMATMAIVINMSKKTVKEKIEQTEACGVEILDKISINSDYVCYNSASNEVIFSINRENINLDSLLISVFSETDSQTFKFRNGVDENFGGKILSYPDRSEIIRLPIKKSGKTFIVTDFADNPVKIEIAPIINGKQCEVVDSINEIVDCSITTILN